MKTFLRYLITSVIGLAIVLVIVLAKNVFSQTDAKTVLQIWCDASFVAGVVLICTGSIVLASNGGVFYMLGYSISVLFATIFSSKVRRKYKTFYDYSEAKKENKHSFAYILIVGFVLAAIAGILLWRYYAV